ncbi:MAG TPA: thioredoxin domain-containing protein [Candidatus Saccharimonadales bacterium]
MNKTFWAIIAVIVVIFGGIIVFNKNDANAPSGNAKPTNHIIGEGKSGVTLVEYGDFECSACGQYYPIVEQVKEKYRDQIFFQFRNLPLLQVHPNAFAASRAAEAADKQGKFWDMYNLLYQNQVSWAGSDAASKTFEQYATQLGLNLEKFKSDAASSEVNAVINADIAEFKKTKEIMSTPTFFLDGKRIKAASLEEFSKLIDEAIAAKSKQQ